MGRETQNLKKVYKENKLMYTNREEGGGMNWEMRIDIYTLLCIKQITNENLLYSTGNSPQCSVVT